MVARHSLPSPRDGRTTLTSSARDRLLHDLADRIAAIPCSHALRVGIDGIDGAGKTTLADDLVVPVEERGRPVIRASIDSFQRPRVERYRQGELSPRGYYEDAFDFRTVRADLLEPLGPGGNGLYRTESFDVTADRPRKSPLQQARADSVLLFDGVFLLRPELADCWELRIFVQVSFGEALRRGAARDAERWGSVEVARDRYERRYLAGQRIYLEAIRPTEKADLVIDNEDPAAPRLTAMNDEETV